MSKAAQLKRKAAEFEQKRQYDRALAVYVQAIEASAGFADELDIPLYNRVGDLYLRLGHLEQAVGYYESAVDLYAEGGFFNNAIALCNKVLRQAPARSVIYYKLGKISARKGFNSDAKQNFLEYASRMERSGDIAEAFRALKEFADLCPGQDDVRLMLAEQLARAGWTDEALDQLQTVYQGMLAEDRSAEAAATLQRIRALDPTFEPRTGRSRTEQKREGLVFIDVDAPTTVAAPARTPVDVGVPDVPPDVRPLTAERFGEVELPPPADIHVQRTLDESPLAGLTPLEDPLITLAADAALHGSQMQGMEPTSYDGASSMGAGTDVGSDNQPHGAGDLGTGELLGLERTSFDVAPLVGSGGTAAGDLSDERDEHTFARPDAAGVVWPAEGSLAPEKLSEVGDGTDLTGADDAEGDSFGDAVTGYLASLSTEVGHIEGGLPDDLAILPPEAVDEEQFAPPGGSQDGPVPARSDDDFVDLNAWLTETEQPRNPRMTGEDETQDDGVLQTDFSRMLETFKQGVADNVDDTDLDSHYDLGVAYMEMGLLDEATAQFQKVLRGDPTPERRIRAYESLGQSFIESGDYRVALDSLKGGLAEPGLGDAKLVGVLYLLGYASERLEAWPDAEAYYRRVFAVDIHFRDVNERLRRSGQVT